MTDNQAAASSSQPIEIVTTTARLEEIRPEWEALWQDAGGLVFQSHAWISAWWNTLPERQDGRLRIGLIRKEGRLVAVAPMAISRRNGIRLLEWAARSHSDYCDILAAPECPAADLEHLWKELSASGGFDVVLLNRLLPDAKARSVAEASSVSAVALKPNHRQEASHRVRGDWPDGAGWLAGQPKKIRQEYRRHQRILSEMGELRFRLVADDEPLEPILARMAELKRGNLTAQNKQSALFNEESQTLAALVDVLRKHGLLRLFLLECGGRIAAASINFVQNDAMMAYVTTYDPDFARGSPGDVLIMDYIQWSLDHGLGVVDFLCGSERFKNKFATEAVALNSFLGAATIRGSAVALADRVREVLRQRKVSD